MGSEADGEKAAEAQAAIAAAERTLNELAAAVAAASERPAGQPDGQGESMPGASMEPGPTDRAGEPGPAGESGLASEGGSPSGSADAVRRGRELAEILDALDRQLAERSRSGQPPGERAESGESPSPGSASSDGSPAGSQPGLDTPAGLAESQLRAAAEAERQTMAAARQRQAERSPHAPRPPGRMANQMGPGESDGGRGSDEDAFYPVPLSTGDFAVRPVVDDARDWGALRSRSEKWARP